MAEIIKREDIERLEFSGLVQRDTGAMSHELSQEAAEENLTRELEERIRREVHNAPGGSFHVMELDGGLPLRVVARAILRVDRGHLDVRLTPNILKQGYSFTMDIRCR